jgi:hypothetical protein
MIATPPVRAPAGTLKTMLCGLPVQFCALVSASRNEPGPVSSVFVTVKVSAKADTLVDRCGGAQAKNRAF